MLRSPSPASSPQPFMSSRILATPVQLPHSLLTIRNRIVKAALTERLCDAYGRVSPQLLRLYTEWGKGGYGLIVTGNILVRPTCSMEHQGCPFIDPDAPEDCIGAFAKIAQVSKARGAQVIAQISHARREASDTYPAGYALSYLLTPLILKPSSTRSSWKHDVVRRFAHAAVTLYRAGFGEYCLTVSSLNWT